MQNSKFKIILIFLVSFFGILFFFKANSALALDVPTIAASAKGPNQINLTWSAVANPGWGYKVEIQSDGDSRYSTWTELGITRNGRNYLPYWVTEPHYKDVTDGSGTSAGSPAQFQMYGLKYGTTYNFRVRCYGQTDAGVEVHGGYSNTASAITATPASIKYVDAAAPGPNYDGSWQYPWLHLYDANGVGAGTLVLVRGGNYPSDRLRPTKSGTQANRIVFQAYYGEMPTITSSYLGYNALIEFEGVDYVTVDGINVDCSTHMPKVWFYGSGNASRNALVNADIDAAGDTFEAINFGGDYYASSPPVTASYNLVHNCYLHDIGAVTNQGSGCACTMQGDSYDGRTQYNVVQYTNIRRGAHDTGMEEYSGIYNQWKNNLFDGGWGLGWGTFASYGLFEGNEVKDCGKYLTQRMPKPAIEVAGAHNTIRRNILRDGAAFAPGTGYSSSGIELNSSSQYSLIYNNTIVYNGRYGLCAFNNTPNTTIKNNIFYENLNTEKYAADYRIQVGLFDAITGTIVDYNLILPVVNGIDMPSAISNVRTWSGYYYNTDDANNNWTEWGAPNGHNITDSPAFIDYAKRELHLKSTSPLRNKGVSVIDSTWGTTGDTDLGAFKYYSIGAQNPDITPPQAPTGVAVN